VEDPLFKGFKHTFPALEWHGDTFEIPEEAVKLAESELCSNQAFRFKNAYGLQFHLETTPEMLEEWVEVYADELNEEENDVKVMLKETKKKADIYCGLSNGLFTNFFGIG
jgi:GMP synthase-like glutamine amidotransferase